MSSNALDFPAPPEGVYVLSWAGPGRRGVIVLRVRAGRGERYRKGIAHGKERTSNHFARAGDAGGMAELPPRHSRDEVRRS